MKEIIVKNQKQLDKLPKVFKKTTKIIIDASEQINLFSHRENSIVILVNKTTVNIMWGNSQVNVMRNNSQVNVMRNNSQVNEMRDNSQVNVMWGNSQVNVMWGNSQVNEMLDNSQVNEMWGNSQVNVMRENSQVNVMRENSQVNVMRNNSQVNEMWGNSQVNEMWGNSQVNEMWGNSQVNEMLDNSQVNVMWGNSQTTLFETAIARCYSNKSKITAKHNSVIICFDCKPTIIKDKSVQVIKQRQFKHTKDSFIDIYPMVDSEHILLFKSVNPETNCDFYTGKIKYNVGEEIICPDFDEDKNRQCGGGLHLSPKPEMALKYNKGKLLKCKVHVDDFVVYPNDITKVRCRKVFVIGEYKTEKEN